MCNREKAQKGLKEIKEAILSELENNYDGLKNKEIVKRLGLHSDYENKHKNFLSYSILGILLSEKKIVYSGQGRNKRYKLVT